MSRHTPLERLAYNMTEAAAVLGVSPDFLTDHIAHELRIVRKGRCKLVPRSELIRWLDANATRTLE